MIKNFVMVAALLIFGQASFAQKGFTICGQGDISKGLPRAGYALMASNEAVTVYLNGKEVGNARKTAEGQDGELSVIVYAGKRPNGIRVDITSENGAPIAADIFRGGVVGYNLVASLTQCKFNPL